jgi:hypothetical protein
VSERAHAGELLDCPDIEPAGIEGEHDRLEHKSPHHAGQRTALAGDHGKGQPEPAAVGEVVGHPDERAGDGRGGRAEQQLAEQRHRLERPHRQVERGHQPGSGQVVGDRCDGPGAQPDDRPAPHDPPGRVVELSPHKRRGRADHQRDRGHGDRQGHTGQEEDQQRRAGGQAGKRQQVQRSRW